MSVPILKIRDKDGNVTSIPAIKGAPGKSAYEYAKDAGYTGTEEEFAEQLANASSGGSGGASINHVEITQAEYDSLTEEEKNADVVYFITDAEGEVEETFYKEVYVDENLFGGRFLVRSKGGFCKANKAVKLTSTLTGGVEYILCTLPEALRPTSSKYIPTRWAQNAGSGVHNYNYFDVFMIIEAETGNIVIIPKDNIGNDKVVYLEIEWFSREWS